MKIPNLRKPTILKDLDITIMFVFLSNLPSPNFYIFQFSRFNYYMANYLLILNMFMIIYTCWFFSLIKNLVMSCCFT